MIKEVRKLQGDLADYNLIVDKSRNKTDPQEIALVYQQLKARNDAERRRVDEVFSERHEKEQDIKQVEQEIAQVQSVADQKLTMLSQQQRMQYAQLQVRSAPRRRSCPTGKDCIHFRKRMQHAWLLRAGSRRRKRARESLHC